jgi:hypothetical protein
MLADDEGELLVGARVIDPLQLLGRLRTAGGSGLMPSLLQSVTSSFMAPTFCLGCWAR